MLAENPAFRIFIGTICTGGLVLIFLYQRYDFAGALQMGVSSIEKFIINRTIRFLLNDLFAIGVVFALFPLRKYVLFAFIVQIAGFVLFLIPYFVLKVNFPGYNGPLINFLHRLILNPTLVLLLIPAFYYQQLLQKNKRA